MVYGNYGCFDRDMMNDGCCSVCCFNCDDWMMDDFGYGEEGYGFCYSCGGVFYGEYLVGFYLGYVFFGFFDCYCFLNDYDCFYCGDYVCCGDCDMWDCVGDEIVFWFGDEDVECCCEMDVCQDESYCGCGLKGYLCFDSCINEDVYDCLMDYLCLDVSDISVIVQDGEVILSGFVCCCGDKCVVEDCVELVMGVKNVQNNLCVKEQDMM